MTLPNGPELFVVCENGHERRAVHFSEMNRQWRCSCGAALSQTVAWDLVPEPYRPHGDVVGSYLQGMLDYDVLIVLRGAGMPDVEFPRRADRDAYAG